MITSDNQPKWTATSDEDFTETHYRQLLRAAKASYRFATYDAIPWGTRFILWRHDLDFSINRAAALAGIEAEEGVKSTYFVNPRSEFYNPFEPEQARMVKRILSLGHRLGLHLDAVFCNPKTEKELNMYVEREGRWLEDAFDVKLDAFSFHNPIQAHLNFEKETYGGLVNAYSYRLKKEVSYCSDSNGYWRFRRLHDVLSEASDACLQILTHPEWWQKLPLPPRQRIHRSIYGRAEANLRSYDTLLIETRRRNHWRAQDTLLLIKHIDSKTYSLCDFLWNREHFAALFCELWRLLITRIHSLIVTYTNTRLDVPPTKAHELLESTEGLVDCMDLLEIVVQLDRTELLGRPAEEYIVWLEIKQKLANGKILDNEIIERGAIFLCHAIHSIDNIRCESLSASKTEWKRIVTQIEEEPTTLNSIGSKIKIK